MISTNKYCYYLTEVKNWYFKSIYIKNVIETFANILFCILKSYLHESITILWFKNNSLFINRFS